MSANVRYVEYVKKIRNPDFNPSEVESDENPRVIQDSRNRRVTEIHRGTQSAEKITYHFRPRPDLGEAYAHRKIEEVSVPEHADKFVSQSNAYGPIFQYAEDLETEIEAGPVRKVFESNPEIVQDLVYPIVRYFFEQEFVTKKDFEAFVEETKASLARKANAKSGRPKGGNGE